MLWHRIISICYVFLSNNNLARFQYAFHTFLVVKKRACDYFQLILSNSFAFYLVWIHTETQKRYAEERRCFRLKIEKIPYVTCTEKEKEKKTFSPCMFWVYFQIPSQQFSLAHGTEFGFCLLSFPIGNQSSIDQFKFLICQMRSEELRS